MAKYIEPKGDSADKLESTDEVSDTANWRNEHGDPDFAHLMSLVDDGSTEALEKLRYIAEDLDVEYDANISPVEMVERIRTVVAENGDVGEQPTT